MPPGIQISRCNSATLNNVSGIGHDALISSSGVSSLTVVGAKAKNCNSLAKITNTSKAQLNNAVGVNCGSLVQKDRISQVEVEQYIAKNVREPFKLLDEDARVPPYSVSPPIDQNFSGSRVRREQRLENAPTRPISGWSKGFEEGWASIRWEVT